MEKMACCFREEIEIKKGNRILVKQAHGEWIEKDSFANINVAFRGTNSLLKIHENVNCKSLNISMGEGSYVELGEGFRTRHLFTIDARGKNSTIVFGRNANIGNGGILAGDEDNLEVIIGDDFLSAQDLYIRNSDGHTIFNMEGGDIINMPRVGVHIGKHVWCSYGVTILKDVNIPDNCIVAAGAIVCKDFHQENCIIGGVPAHIIKTGVNWDERCIKDFKK